MGTAEQFLLLQHLTLLAPLGKGETQMTPSKRQKDESLGKPHPGGEYSPVCEARLLILQGMFLSPISWDPSPHPGGSGVSRSGLLPVELALLEESRSAGPLFSAGVRDWGLHPLQNHWWLLKGLICFHLCSAQAEWVGSCARV